MMTLRDVDLSDAFKGTKNYNRSNEVAAILPHKPRILFGFHNLGYERRGIISVEKFLNILMTHKGGKFNFTGGIPAKLNSKKYKLFAKSQTCVSCGISGNFFALEQSLRWDKESKSWHIIHASGHCWHFNMYAITELGTEILMTQDHIMPKSHGGLNDLSNLQTMCQTCNMAKGSKLPDEWPLLYGPHRETGVFTETHSNQNASNQSLTVDPISATIIM